MLVCQLDGSAIPEQLCMLLTDSRVLFVGRAISGDISRLVANMKDCESCTIQSTDVARVCKERGLIRNAALSLAEIARIVLHKELPKPDDIQQGPWSQHLNEAQKKYAALDAACGLDIWHAAQLEDATEPEPASTQGHQQSEGTPHSTSLDRAAVLRKHFTKVIFTDNAHADNAKSE